MLKLLYICLYLLISLIFYCNSLHLHISKSRFRQKLIQVKKSSKHDDDSSKKSDTLPLGPKEEALQGVLQNIEKLYGKGSMVKLGETSALDIAKFSSGSCTLDLALGGGYPRGRVIEIYGPESSGKTTLALHAIAEIQKTGGNAAFIDAEHALDPGYAQNLGVNIDDLFVCQPDSGEMALDVVDHLVRSSAMDLVVVDSVAALVPRVELEGNMDDQQVGLQARLMSKALRKITGSLSKSQTTVIFLNQLRSKVGVIFGSPEITAGGNALKFYSSVRLDIRRKEILGNNEGILAKVKVVKNKVFKPFGVVELEILFGTGINRLSCLIDAAEALGIIERKGAWYNMASNGFKLGQGRKSVIEILNKDTNLLQDIENAVKLSFIDSNKISYALPAAIDITDGNSEDIILSRLNEDENAYSE